jgi:hypothetical protein
MSATAHDSFVDYPSVDLILFLTGGAGFFANGDVLYPTYGPFDNFASYNIGTITSLNGGQNFYAAGAFFDGLVANAYDTFANYPIGDIAALNQGVGFYSNGIFFNALQVGAYDTFSGYPVGGIINLNLGTGFFSNGIFIRP